MSARLERFRAGELFSRIVREVPVLTRTGWLGDSAASSWLYIDARSRTKCELPSRVTEHSTETRDVSQISRSWNGVIDLHCRSRFLCAVNLPVCYGTGAWRNSHVLCTCSARMRPRIVWTAEAAFIVSCMWLEVNASGFVQTPLASRSRSHHSQHFSGKQLFRLFRVTVSRSRSMHNVAS